MASVDSVEDYYGEAKPKKKLKELPKSKSINCSCCGKDYENNIALMLHIKEKCTLIWLKKSKACNLYTCRYCYADFESEVQLKNHIDYVHTYNGSEQNICKICEIQLPAEELLNHMKTLHSKQEMPYRCSLCHYKCSFYKDLLEHFYTGHLNSRRLMCIFCCKIFKSTDTYVKHMVDHCSQRAFSCKCCRLSFLNKDDFDHHIEKRHKKYPTTNHSFGQSDKTTSAFVKHCGVKIVSTKITKSDSVKDKVTEFLAVPAETESNNVDISTSCEECKLIISDDIGGLMEHFQVKKECTMCSYNTCCIVAFKNHVQLIHDSKKLLSNNSMGSQTVQSQAQEGPLENLSGPVEFSDLSECGSVKNVLSSNNETAASVCDLDNKESNKSETNVSLKREAPKKIEYLQPSKIANAGETRYQCNEFSAAATNGVSEELRLKRSRKSKIKGSTSGLPTMINAYRFQKKYIFCATNCSALLNNSNTVPPNENLAMKATNSSVDIGKPPLPVTNVTFDNLGASSFVVNWVKSTSEVTSYQLTFQGKGLPTTHILTGDQCQARLLGLTSGTEYSVTITSKFGEEQGGSITCKQRTYSKVEARKKSKFITADAVVELSSDDD